jgi:hypothetical protein
MLLTVDPKNLSHGLQRCGKYVPFQIRTKPGSVTVQKRRSLSREAMDLYKPFVITPQQILAILNRLATRLYFTLVLTCAATVLRASKIRLSALARHSGE